MFTFRLDFHWIMGATSLSQRGLFVCGAGYEFSRADLEESELVKMVAQFVEATKAGSTRGERLAK